MAGFFGLFNYEKEGPGIEKNAPKKKTFIVFFETFFRNFWKFITINFVYLLMCIPIVTIGLANAGITNVTRNIARDKHSFGLSDFFETIKKNWKQSLIVGIINTVLVVLISYVIYFYWYQEGWGMTIGIGVTFFLAFVIANMNFFIWTLLITFRLSFKQLIKNSFKFVFINFKMNLFCGFILLLVYAVYAAILFFVAINSPLVFSIEIVFAVCTLPAFRFLLIQYCTFPAIKKYMIDPYYAEHPNDDIELRLGLGLEVPTQSEENTEETEEN